MFLVFLYSGYVLHHVAVSHAAENPVRISARANHIYLLLIILLNLLAYRINFNGRIKRLEAMARSALFLSGLCAVVGFFMQISRTDAAHNMMSPAAVVLTFLSVVLFLLDGWRVK